MTLTEELADLYAKIEKPLANGDPVGLMQDLTDRSAWLARSAQLLGDAQRVYDYARGEAAEAAAEQGIGGNAAKDFIQGAVANENRLLTLADRLNSMLVHQIDAIRTLLSFEKQTMERH